MDKSTTTLDCNDCDDKQTGTMAEQIARAICDFQHTSTGHTPTAIAAGIGLVVGRFWMRR